MTSAITPGHFIAGLLEPIGRALTPASAREILALEAGDAARERIAELARRCDEGVLTPSEQAEYELFVEIGDLVALMQVRARHLLAGIPSGV